MKLASVVVLGTSLAFGIAAGCSGDDETAGPSSSSSSSSTGGSTTGSGGAGGTGAGEAGGMGGAGGVAMPFTSQGSSSYEAQTSIAADDQGGMVAAWIAFFDDDTTAIGYAVTRDGGTSWTAPRYVAAPDGRRSSNPTVAVNGAGQFALSWIGFRLGGTVPDEHVYLAFLEGADDAFVTPLVASDDGTADTLDFDKPSLAVDAVGDFLLTWADFTATPALTFARTSDGSSFDRHSFAGDMTFGNLASLCLDRSLGPNAPLYVVHLAIGATLVVHRSIDGGVTWTPHTVPASDVLFQDPTCAAVGSDLWIAYAVGTGFVPGSDTPADRIEVVHSTDGGDTMLTPVEVSDVSGDVYLYPRLVQSYDGKLATAYYQGRVGEPVSLVVSTSQNGTTWTTSPIAPAGTFTLDTTLANWLGAYFGVAVGQDRLAATFTDNSGVKDRISFATFVTP